VSLLEWESTTARAAAALARLEAAVVDFNDLRHCMPDELARLMGEGTPLVGERCLRLRTVLSRVFSREHAMTLVHLSRRGPGEARAYLESLEGMPHAAAARVALLGLGIPAMPVDMRLVRLLLERGVVPAGTTPERASALLEERIGADAMLGAYWLLRAWSDRDGTDAEPGHLESRVVGAVGAVGSGGAGGAAADGVGARALLRGAGRGNGRARGGAGAGGGASAGKMKKKPRPRA
jgi:endonuclease III